MNVLITPSILSADLTRLQEEVDSVEPYCDWIQIDVMDGKFVPRTVFGPSTLTEFTTTRLLDAHLMIVDPASHFQEYLDAGAGNITFHAEAVPDEESQRALLQAIKSGGASAGIAINPETPLSAVQAVLPECDLLLVMSVHPGASGQSFIEDVLSKVQEARAAFPHLMIQMDGGIDDATARLCKEAGANNLVSASYIFKSADREAAIRSLRSL